MQISSVCGMIPVEDLGNTLIHEHIICTSPDFYYGYSRWLPRLQVIDIACRKIRFAAEQYNIRTIVDGTPLSLGRDLDLLKEVSTRTQVNIIASAGFYFYPSFAQRCLSVKTLSSFMIREINEGPIRPAMLKCALDAEGFTPDVEKMLTVIACVQTATSLPVFVHTYSQTRNGVQALDFLIRNGVNPRKIIVGHTADSNDLTYPLELLQRGCYISVDRIGSTNYAVKGAFLLELLKQGWEKHVFVAHDHICCRDSILNDPPDPQGEPGGLDWIHGRIVPFLKENNITGETVDQLFRQNVIALYRD